MATAYSLYLHSKGALAVRVDGSAKKPTITRAAEMLFQDPGPDDAGLAPDPAAVRESRAIQLRAWLKKEKLLGTPLALCVDNGGVILREMKLAFRDRRQIDKVITFQVEGVIPSTPIEDLAIGYTILEQGDDGSKVLISAAHRTALRNALELLESVSIPVAVADSAIGGALNLRRLTPALATLDSPTIWIDMQGSYALIAVLDGTQILNVRSVRVPEAASRELQAAAEADATRHAAEHTEELLVVDDEAGATKIADEPAAEKTDARISHGPMFHSKLVATESTHGLNADAVKASGQDAGAADPGAGSSLPKPDALIKLLAVEVRRTMLGAQSEKTVSRVIVTGVPESLAPVVAGIESELGVQQVETMDLLAPLVPRDRKGVPKVAMPASLMIGPAAGVALKTMGGDATNVDFLTGDLAPLDTFDQIKNPLAIGVTMLFMVTCVLLMLVLRQRGDLMKDIEAVTSESTDMDGNHVKSVKDAFDWAYEKAKERAKAYPEEEEEASRVTAAQALMSSEIAAIKAGNKRNFPALYDGEMVYDEVLKAIKKAITVPPPGPNGENKEAWHFYLKSFTFNQNPNKTDPSKPTTGSLTIECFAEPFRDGKPTPIKEMLEAIEVENPAWDRADPKKKVIRLFSVVESVRPPGKDNEIERGTRKTPKGTEPVRMNKHVITCTLTAVARPAPKKAKKTAGT
jgi:hypothetical protein